MKKLLLVICLCGMCSIGVQSQTWAPMGAVWYYSYTNFWIDGYIKIEAGKDTTIMDKQCRELVKTLFSYDHVNIVYDTVIMGKEYTYSDNDKVYILRNNQFYTLYDFSAKPGDSWVIPHTFDIECDTIGEVIVTDTSSVVVNGTRLRSLTLQAAENSHWMLGSQAYESIGSIDSYMLPELTMLCNILDVFEGGPLRCYEDNTLGYFSTNIASSCDYIAGISKKKKENTFQLLPNPGTNTLYIQTTLKDAKLEMYDANGRLVVQQNINETTSVNTSALNPSMYFYRVMQNGEVKDSGKWVKQQ